MGRNYWDMVLDEVLNKRSTRRFTNDTKEKGSEQTKRRRLRMYILGPKFKDIYFSRREAECMAHLLRGKSAGGVAKILNLSPRTIEFYIKNMKNKLDCQSKFELIDLVGDSDFLKNIDF